MRGFWGLLVLVACTGSAALSNDATRGDDASPPDDTVDATPPEVCPPGWSRIGAHACIPAVMACDPGASARDPTCVPGGVRTAALTPWECPTGWRRDDDLGCVPTLRTDCPDGSGPLPDGTCTDTHRCPDDLFPEVPEGVEPARALYVDDNAPEGGDGTRTRPLRDLSEALLQVQDHGAVLVAEGDYPVFGAPQREVFLRGVCARRVRLLPRRESVETELLLARGPQTHLTVEGVSATTVDHLLLRVDQQARVTVRSVAFRSLRAPMVSLRDVSTAEVSEAWYQNTDVPTSANDDGSAMVHADASRATLRRCSSSGLDGLLLRSVEGSRLDVSDCVGSHGPRGLASRGSELAARRVALAGSRSILGVGLFASSGRTSVEDVSVRGGSFDVVGGRARVDHLSIHEGSLVGDFAGQLVAHDVAVFWPYGPPRTSANCVDARNGAWFKLSRARLRGCWESGAYAYLLGTIALEDSWIRDVRPRPDGLLGVGAASVFGGHISLNRVLIEQTAMAGVAAVHINRSFLQRLPLESLIPGSGDLLGREPSRLELLDVVLREPARRVDQVGLGVMVGANATLVAERLALLDQQGAALIATDAGFDRQIVVDWFTRVRPGLRFLVPFLPASLDDVSRAEIRNLFVGPVSPATVLYDPITREALPKSRGAWGAYTAASCRLEIEGGYFDGGDRTESALVSLGDLRLRGGVIAHTAGCARTRNASTDGSITVSDVRFAGNRRDEPCVDNTIPQLRLPFSPN